MALFRSKKDINFSKRIAHELMEKIIGESVVYYAISKKLTNANFYGESKKKIVDPPVQIYAIVEWLPQEASTTNLGQDLIYKVNFHVLKEHLDSINIDPNEGDMIEYNSKYFEIINFTSPRMFFGKEEENIGYKFECVSVRKGVFETAISGSPDQAHRTHPDEDTRNTYTIGDTTFAFTGSVY